MIQSPAPKPKREIEHVLRNESIICFAGEDWWYHHPHSKNHIMKRLARSGNKVLFVNSISMGLPSLSSPNLIAKIRRKLASYARYIRRTDDGIIVVSPVAVPFYSSSIGRLLNRILLLVQVKLLMVGFDLRDPILWVAIPTANQVVGRLSECALVYQVSDKYEANQMDHATSAQVIRSMHLDLLSKADLVYYSGRKLYDEALSAHPEAAPKSKLLEQAVDFEHFAAAALMPEQLIPEDIRRIPGPRLGYFGAIESWLIDQSLIRYVASRCPEWHWVLIGLRAAPLEIEALPAVHYLGSKPYDQVPLYAAGFDVCVLPWVTDNEFVNYGSAIKVREYLATGKPVVITPLYEYEHMDGILRIARSGDDFIRKIEDALERDGPDKRVARQRAVIGATWDARAEAVSTDIASIIDKRGHAPRQSG
jgi:glycosyltransferase involved in cell wall biosynthesis